MSTVAAIQNAKVTDFWLRNACAKHGVPYEDLNASTVAMMEIARKLQDEETSRKPPPEPSPEEQQKPAPESTPAQPPSAEPIKVEVEPIKFDPVKVDPVSVSPVEVSLPTPITTPGAPATTPSEPGSVSPKPWWKKYLPWLLGSLLALIGITSLLTAMFWNTSPDVEIPQQDTSVLQWLEDENYHIDPEIRS